MKFNKLISMAKKDKDVLAVALFGSSVRGKGRDVDICLFLHEKASNLKMSKIRLKYLSEFDYDIQIFQQLPMYIRNRILKEGKILHCSDMDKLYSIYFDTIKEYGFYKKLYDMYLEEVGNG
jgi:uncharacterized protein